MPIMSLISTMPDYKNLCLKPEFTVHKCITELENNYFLTFKSIFYYIAYYLVNNLKYDLN